MADAPTTTSHVELEFHQLELTYADLRLRRTSVEGRLLASLEENSQQQPVVVVPSPTPGLYRVIDGYKRIRALHRLGVDTVRAVVWQMSDGEALLLAHGLRTSASATALEEGWLLSALHRQGFSVVELARRLCRSTSWVSRRLSLVQELPDEI